MRLKTTKEQTKKLIDLGFKMPNEIDNIFIGLNGEYLSFFDETEIGSIIKVIDNYSLDYIISIFTELYNDDYILDYINKQYCLILYDDQIVENELIDVFVNAIVKIKEKEG